MIDDPSSGSLERTAAEQRVSEGGSISPILGGITHLAFDGKFMIARMETYGAGAQWVVFEFAAAKFETCPTEAKAVATARDKGYAGPDTLEPLAAHYHRTFPGKN